MFDWRLVFGEMLSRPTSACPAGASPGPFQYESFNFQPYRPRVCVCVCVDVDVNADDRLLPLLV